MYQTAKKCPKIGLVGKINLITYIITATFDRKK
jgi:hypothetical protein